MNTTTTQPQGCASTKTRHYLLVDDSAGWFVRLARVEVSVTYTEPRKRGEPSIRTESLIAENCLDVPSAAEGGFVRNIYRRHSPGTYRTRDGQTHTAFALSPEEYDRVMRLVQLASAYDEFIRLAGYNV